MLNGFIANLVRFYALWDSPKCNEGSNQCLSVYQGHFTGNPLSHFDKLAARLGGGRLSPVSQTLFPRLVVSLEEEAQVKPLLARLTEISRIEPGN